MNDYGCEMLCWGSAWNGMEHSGGSVSPRMGMENGERERERWVNLWLLILCQENKIKKYKKKRLL